MSQPKKNSNPKVRYTTVEEVNENRGFAVFYLILLIIVMLVTIFA